MDNKSLYELGIEAQIEFNHNIQELMEQHNKDVRELSHGSHLNNEGRIS